MAALRVPGLGFRRLCFWAMRRIWAQLLAVAVVLAPAACGLVGGIEDITVVDPDLPDGTSGPLPEGGGPDRPDANADPPDVVSDVTADAPKTTCDPLTPFATPVPVPTLNSAADDSTPRLSPDELTVYLASTRPGHLGGGSIYLAKRASKAAAFDAPTLAPVINTNGGLVYHPAPTGDLLRIFLQVTGGGPTDLYLAMRASIAVEFGTPAPLANVNSGGSEFIPFVTPDGTSLYFSSNRGGSFLLYQSLAAGAAYGTATLVPGLGSGNNSAVDTAPVLSADLLSIYFASTRIDAGSNAYDLFVARRTTPTGTFATPTLVTELNAANAGASDVPSWLSADGCRLYMTSDRASGTFDVYLATRTP